MARARYQIEHGDPDALHITDRWDGMAGVPTVACDAGLVVRDLHRAGRLGARRLFCRAPNGRIDEIRHDGQGGLLGVERAIDQT